MSIEVGFEKCCFVSEINWNTIDSKRLILIGNTLVTNLIRFWW